MAARIAASSNYGGRPMGAPTVLNFFANTIPERTFLYQFVENILLFPLVPIRKMLYNME